MRIFKSFKPQHLQLYKNKHDVVKLITSGCNYVETPTVEGYTYMNQYGQICVRAFNLIKHNRKVEKLNDGQYKISKMYWDVYIYDIPVDIFVYLNLNFKQQNRNFIIK